MGDTRQDREVGRIGPSLRYLAWVPGDRFGGCEAYALAVAEYLGRAGWNVTILCSYRRTAAAFQERLPGARIVLRAQPRLPSTMRGREKILRVVERWRCLWFFARHQAEVVHAALPWHIHSIGFIEACTRLRLKTLVTIQLCAAGHVPARHYVAAYRAARKAGIQFCAISEDNRRLLQAYYGLTADEVPVIRNRPNLPSTVLGRSRDSIRGALGLTQDDIVVLTVGQFFAQKGYDLIIRAASSIAARFPRAVFVWAGDGDERKGLEALADSLQVRDRIRMLGWRDDVPALLAAADVFLFPTRYEGGESFAVLEAVAAKVPVVASTASGIPELLRDGEDARLFAVDDVAGLIAGVIDVLSHPTAAAERSERAATRLSSYTHQDMLEDTLALLRRVAQRAP